jgi:hypothetical protein
VLRKIFRSYAALFRNRVQVIDGPQFSRIDLVQLLGFQCSRLTADGVTVLVLVKDEMVVVRRIIDCSVRKR